MSHRVQSMGFLHKCSLGCNDVTLSTAVFFPTPYVTVVFFLVVQLYKNTGEDIPWAQGKHSTGKEGLGRGTCLWAPQTPGVPRTRAASWPAPILLMPGLLHPTFLSFPSASMRPLAHNIPHAACQLSVNKGTFLLRRNHSSCKIQCLQQLSLKMLDISPQFLRYTWWATCVISV